MLAELTHYVAPKRKAVEMSANADGPMLVTTICLGHNALPESENSG